MNRWLNAMIVVLAAAPMAPAFQTTQPAGDGILGDTYVAGGATSADPPTGVEGGVEGSSYITRSFRDRHGVDTTFWIFVESSSSTGKLSLQLTGGAGPKLQESRWGYYLISQAWGRYSLGGEYDQAQLSSLLADFYAAGRAPRHVPFLMGKGWPQNSQGIHGACKGDVDSLAQKMMFNVATDGKETSGQVIWQDLRGGTLFPGQRPTLTVRYDGEPCQRNLGPGFQFATPDVVEDDNEDGFIHMSAWLNPADAHGLHTPCGLKGPAHVFRLPAVEPGTMWRIGRFDLGTEVALAAFTDGGAESLACQSGNDPELREKAPAKGALLVVVQMPEHHAGWINLYAYHDAGKRVDLAPKTAQFGQKKD